MDGFGGMHHFLALHHHLFQVVWFQVQAVQDEESASIYLLAVWVFRVHLDVRYPIRALAEVRDVEFLIIDLNCPLLDQLECQAEISHDIVSSDRLAKQPSQLQHKPTCRTANH